MHMKKRNKLIGLIIATGILASATSVSAYTREYTFHMNTSYLHGNTPNCGYAATKSDDEQTAYVTMNKYNKESGSPKVSMWVAPSGSYTQATDAWTWTGSAPRKSLGYYSSANAKQGKAFQLCAEQFGSDSVVASGKWTP